ncbi:MAG: AI-2E family transporter [Bacteroidetes bacterium]|jgi:predicted PurR-regulated permease PerM|nr:AI-2E family transporter [Bacteroidota bacterium]
MNLSFKNIFYVLASAFGLFAFLVLAKPMLIPLAFALLISFILLPLTKKFEYWGVNSIFSALFSILGVVLLLSGGIFFLSTQIIQLSTKFAEFQDKILQIFTQATLYMNNNFGFLPTLEESELIDRLKDWLAESSGLLVSKTFNNTASFVGGLVSVIIFTFLFLIYRNSFTHAFTCFFPTNKRTKAFQMFKKVQLVGKKYLFGMTVLIIILGTASSIGLLIIGIDNPFLFGFLAGILAIVPYIGTLIGAAIPVLYAFLFYDTIWKPIAVIILFWFIQSIESNFLSPKIVGRSLNVNALTVILSIIVGASVWGVAGMILFLPFTAMFKTVCEEYEELKPMALLIGEQNVKPGRKSKFYIYLSKLVNRFNS